MAFDTIEPFGDLRADWRNGMLAAIVANALSDGKREITPLDFMPTIPANERKQAVKAARTAQPTTAEQNMAELERIFEATFG